MHFSSVTLRIFRWFVFPVAIAFLWYRVVEKADGLYFPSDFRVWPLAFALALVPINWGLEILKWKKLTHSFYPLSINAAAGAVLAGIFFGLFSPNRLGDAVGKIAALPTMHKPEGTYAFAFGSLAQGLVTILAAALVLPFAASWYEGPLATILRILTWVVPIVFLFASVIYWKRIIPKGWLRWIFPSSIPALVTVPNLHIATTVFAFSGIRYLIFAFQFGLCLLAFGMPTSLFSKYLALIALVYLFSSFIPSAVLGELGIRESMALIFITPVVGAGTEWSLMMAGFTVWIINLLLPGLVGAIQFFGNKTAKQASP